MNRGSVFWVNLEDAHPPELGKVRPGVVISNAVQNEVLDTVVVVPLSSQPGVIWPLRLELRLPGEKRSYAVIPGIRQVNKRRLLDTLGLVSAAQLAELDEAVQAYLSDG